LFALAGKPVPTPRQAAYVARALAARGLDCGGFIEWCSIDRGRVRRARGPGVLDSWIDEYSAWASVRAALEAEGAAERKRRASYLVELEEAERPELEAEPAELEAEAERPEPAPRPVAVVPAVCWRCGGTGELHNLTDLEAFTPCGCAAGRAKRGGNLKT
jgi:hypothetical protein